MKGVLLLSVWLAAICRASPAPLDLAPEPGVPQITLPAEMLAPPLPPLDFTDSHAYPGPPDSEPNIPIGSSLGAGLLASAAIGTLANRARHARDDARRRCAEWRRPMTAL